MRDFRTKFIASTLWSFLEKIGHILIQLIANICYSRTLGPELMGVINYCLLVLFVSRNLSEGGLGVSIIQRKNLSKEYVDTIFTLNLCAVIITIIIILFCSEWFSIIINDESVINYMRFICLIIIFDTFIFLPAHMMIRDLEFGKLARFHLLSMANAALFGCISLIIGIGAWSVFVHYLTFSITKIYFYYTNGSNVPALRINMEAIKDVCHFSSKIWIARLLAELYNHGQSFLVGILYGKEQLGYFSQARQLQQVPTQTISQVLNNVTLPIFSRHQHNLDYITTKLTVVKKYAMILNVGIVIFLFMMAEKLILLLYGTKWEQSAPLFQALIIGYGLLIVIHSVNLSALKSIGQGTNILILEIVKKITGLIALIISIHYFEIMGVPIALGINSFLEILINNLCMRKSLKCRIKNELYIVLAPLITGFVSIYITELLIKEMKFANLVYDIFIHSVIYTFLYGILTIPQLPVHITAELINKLKKWLFGRL